MPTTRSKNEVLHMLRTIKKKLDEGHTPTHISRELGFKSPSSLYSFLNRNGYKLTMTYGMVPLEATRLDGAD